MRVHGRPCALRVAARLRLHHLHLCLQLLKMGVRPGTCHRPQTPQLPWAAVNCPSGWLLIPLGQNVPCVVTEPAEAGGWVLCGVVCDIRLFPVPHPFFKPRQLGAQWVWMTGRTGTPLCGWHAKGAQHSVFRSTIRETMSYLLDHWGTREYK